ncbi:hypothetical protein AB0945_44490 [Streptomyces sp. NPDC005474]|uniref:hypothetical protein n=1 Tax=Streptomyces sp. NPDC005474 TaxID=3154878 RepID=UPI0034567815
MTGVLCDRDGDRREQQVACRELIAVLERRQVKQLDDVEHLPAQVLGRQPLQHILRHLKITFTVARQEVPPH